MAQIHARESSRRRVTRSVATSTSKPSGDSSNWTPAVFTGWERSGRTDAAATDEFGAAIRSNDKTQ